MSNHLENTHEALNPIAFLLAACFVRRPHQGSWHKFQIAAFHPYQLTLAGIENVYFFGEAWDICVMDRPLGYNWWIEFTDKNLFVYEKGITAHTTGIDKTIWLEQEEGLYQFDRNYIIFDRNSR